MVDLACTTGRTGDRASSARHGHHWEDGGRERVRQVVRSQEEGAGDGRRRRTPEDGAPAAEGWSRGCCQPSAGGRGCEGADADEWTRE